jgi:quercetin dioxygenase-like cupin family protein
MIITNLNKLELFDTWNVDDPAMRCRSAFPLLGAMGTKNSAVVYFELEPGDYLGRHTDSAEEVLLVLAGSVDVAVGDEQGRLSQGEMAVVPEMVPHALYNVGQEKARVIGFFGSANIVATFDKTWQPANSNVVDTAAMTQANV